MLTAVPDLIPGRAWVQVIGRVAVHHEDAEPHRLTGSGQRLLAVLVAAGIDGATAERIAEEIWGDAQPNPWRPALRMAVARLRKQLPTGWDVVADGGSYRVTTSDGWVDAWRLAEIASAQFFVIEDDLAWILAGQPFSDVDSLEMVAAATQHLRMLQVTIAERFCAQEPGALSTATCSALAALVRDHPFNDSLALIIAQALATADRRTEAVLALTGFAETYSSEFGAVPPEVTRFLSSTDSGTTDFTGLQTTGVGGPPGLDTRDEIAKELRNLIDVPLLGRATELRRLRTSRGALVTGATGSGKSRLLAEMIVDDRVTETTYVVGDDRLDLPLGPFAVAMPSLRDELLMPDLPMPSRADGSADRAASTRAWRIVLAHLEARSASRPQRLIVDDAHLLDPASLGLVRLLIRSNTTAELTFIVCGRSDFEDSEWTDLVRDAERSGLEPIELEGLDVPELELMAFGSFPNATRQARRGLAVDVHEASGGLPAVAAPLIASADPETLALPEQLAGASVLGRVTASFAERSPEVVAAAAVLGHQFSIGALIALTELDETVIFRVLDDLWSSGMIVETDDPDLVRFRHVLIQRAFLEDVPLFRRGQLHRRAAELTSDPHERADHHANASALVPNTIAAASLLESAKLYAERRQWRKVARELRRVDELPGDLLDVEALSLWAAALDQSGSDGSTHRAKAYAIAASTGDWLGALTAALSGLPEGERPDGDASRVEMLASIPAEELPPERRFDRVFTLSRQLCLMARFGEGLTHADEAMGIAADPDQVALSHVSRWMATRHVEPVAHVIPDEVGAGTTAAIETRVAHIKAINLAEQGDFAQARVQADHFCELAAQSGHPLRIWHAEGMKSMFLLNDAKFEAAGVVAMQNLKFAELHDIQQGPATYVGQQVYSYDRQDRLAELGPQLEPFRANLSGLMLGRAALILTDHALGHSDIATELRDVISEAQMWHGSTFSVLTQIFLARFIVEYTPDLIAGTRDALARYGTNPMVAGFGAASLGPTSRYVAQLTLDETVKRDLIEQSVKAADAQGPLVWRVHTRLDLAELGSLRALHEAEELAAPTELGPMVGRRAIRLRQ